VGLGPKDPGGCLRPSNFVCGVSPGSHKPPMIWRPRLSVGHCARNQFRVRSLRGCGLRGDRGASMAPLRPRVSEVGGSKKPQAGSARGRPGPSLLSRWLPAGMIPWNHQARQVTCVRWIGLRKNSLRFPLSDHAQRGRSWGVTRITGAGAYAPGPRVHPRCPHWALAAIAPKTKKNKQSIT